MTPRARRILIKGGFFVLAVVLFYMALRGTDLSKVGEALRQANYAWLVPLGAVTLMSHFVRAWRWQILLEALPNRQKERVSLRSAFYAVMIGYMVNYALPRLGEVVRTADLAAHEKLSFSGVLGTVVVERILDMVMLALGLLLTFFLLLDQSAALQEYFLTPLQNQISQISLFTVLLLVLGTTALAALIYVFGIRTDNAPLKRLWQQRLQPIWASFKDGLATVLRSPRRVALTISTVLIWFLYVLLAYIPLLMFDIAAPHNMSLLDGMIIMFIGAIGVAIPSPGGFGSYHYITRETLAALYGVNVSLGMTYAVFVHGGQLVLYVVVGFICMILQGSSFSTLRRQTQTAQEEL